MRETEEGSFAERVGGMGRVMLGVFPVKTSPPAGRSQTAHCKEPPPPTPADQLKASALEAVEVGVVIEPAV